MKKPVSASLFFILYPCILVLVAVLLIFGSVSPETNKKIPLATIKTSWEGSGDPMITERYLTTVLEGKISKIFDQLSIESSSDEKQSIIKIFSSEPDESGELFSKVREVLVDAQARLPQDVLPPQLMKPVDPQQVLFFTLETNILSPEKLREVGVEVIAPEIDAFAEVQQTVVLGGQENVLRVCPDFFRMRAAGIDQIGLQHEITHSFFGTGTGVLSGWKSPDDFLDGVNNLFMVNSRGEKFLLRDFCTISRRGEWHPSLSGRQERPAVTLMVYCKEDVSLSMMREKILRKLKASSVVAGNVVRINPFITEDKPTYTYIAPGRAALICVFGFFFLLLLGILAELSTTKKILALAAAGIFLTGIPFILFNLKNESIDEIFHFSVKVPDNIPREQKESLALKLAAKFRQEAAVEDLVWFNRQEITEDPATENKINFYVKLAKENSRDRFIQTIHKKIKDEVGVRLAELSPGEDNFPLFYQVVVKGPELEKLMEMVTTASKEIERTQGVTHVWTVGDAIKPAIELNLDRNQMSALGISFFRVDQLITPQVIPNTGGTKVVVGCATTDYSEMQNMSVANVNGEQISLSAFAQFTKVAHPKAVYHHNLERCMRLYFMADEEGTAERVKEVLSRLPIPQDYKFLITEGE